jgi:hypothetical protein
MKIKFDYGYEAKVPKEFIETFEKEKKEALKNGEEIEWWKKATFGDWVEEGFEDLGSNYYGKIIDKEIALFLIAKHLGTDYGMGGYPREEWMEFKDNNFTYHICCFGWANDENMKSGAYNFIGYKEKIK